VRSRWDPDVRFADPLEELVYVTRLVGADPTLVLHGGGNSSIETEEEDVHGRPVPVLLVKASGWDMATIERAGFTALRREPVRRLVELEELSDLRMRNELRCARLDASAPDPSVEAILHAILPHRVVLHTHADAFLALSDTPRGEELLREVYGDGAVHVPYVMPGFALARRCAAAYARQAHEGTTAVLLANHGVFTFGATAREAYERMIAVVDAAERYLDRHGGPERPVPPARPVDPVRLADLRRRLSEAAGRPLVLTRHADEEVMRFVTRPDLPDVAGRGPATPDHVIRTKRLPLVGDDVAGYVAAYREEFTRRARGRDLVMVDPAPRVVLDPTLGMLTAGTDAVVAAVAADIYRHTIRIIEAAERVAAYRPVDADAVFAVEYWELEQAKLRRAGPPPPLAGRVALVTGAASGIGRACAAALLDAGAAVAGIDRDPQVATTFTAASWLGLVADLVDPAATEAALVAGVERFGGVDLAVLAAGVFGTPQPVAELDPDAWRRVLAVDLDAAAALLARLHPLLARAPGGGRVVVVGSKNVAAPGRGAAAYSAAKAGLTQLARVAALEWAADGITVNVVHPDAVFDTGLWSDELLAARAAAAGLTVEEYRRRNLLGVEITSRDVATLVLDLCGPGFARTTGAQIPIDGGNERVV